MHLPADAAPAHGRPSGGEAAIRRHPKRALGMQACRACSTLMAALRASLTCYMWYPNNENTMILARPMRPGQHALRHSWVRCCSELAQRPPGMAGLARFD